MHRFSSAYCFGMFYILLVVVIIMGCSRKVSRVDLNTNSDSVNFGILNFLKNNKTERQEIISRLGEPRCKYEDGRIITYCLIKDENEELLVSSITCEFEYKFKAELCMYNLVLVFSPYNKLIKHSLLNLDLDYMTTFD